MSVPSPEAQLEFLTKLQRLFAEGEFTATYKFALLIALAELAVERSGTTGAEVFPLRDVAAKFIELYWPSSYEYIAGLPGTRPGVLSANLGDQAAVVTALIEFRKQAGRNVSLVRARSHPAYKALVTRVAATVSAQPLTYLQNFGGRTDAFLYERSPGRVKLKPGVAYCLQRFQPLIQRLARAGWVEHMKGNRRNRTILGEATDLEDFLFRASRTTLTELGRELRKLDGGDCFYCGGAMTEHAVDHFIPFATYPRDLGHNFVLAHAQCNGRKSASLAGRRHLDHWLERLTRRGPAIVEISAAVGLPYDEAATRAIARSSYESTRDVRGLAWVKDKQYEPVDDGFLAAFS